MEDARRKTRFNPFDVFDDEGDVWILAGCIERSDRGHGFSNDTQHVTLGTHKSPNGGWTPGPCVTKAFKTKEDALNFKKETGAGGVPVPLKF